MHTHLNRAAFAERTAGPRSLQGPVDWKVSRAVQPRQRRKDR